MKKSYANETDGMKGLSFVEQSASELVVEMLTKFDELLQRYGLEVVYKINSSDIMWKIERKLKQGEKSKPEEEISVADERKHKSGATIRRIQS